MASSSSSSSSSSSDPPQEKHELFLSFRGEDTRKTFVSHLHAALKRLQIKTYIDYNLERGDEISSTLLKAIEDAKLSVIVFSKNFATSRWCLEEVAKIIECRKTNGQIVVPIFYDVEPTDVRNQTGSFESALARQEERFRGGQKNKVQEWRDALSEAANHSGWDCSVDRMEFELVEDIAADILRKLDSLNNGGLERRIATHKQMAKQKLDKSLRSGNLKDMEDFIATMQQLGELKLEKALDSDDSDVWEDLMATNQRILQLKLDKYSRTLNSKDAEDIAATEQHFLYIQRELSNRINGFNGI